MQTECQVFILNAWHTGLSPPILLVYVTITVVHSNLPMQSSNLEKREPITQKNKALEVNTTTKITPMQIAVGEELLVHDKLGRVGYGLLPP